MLIDQHTIAGVLWAPITDPYNELYRTHGNSHTSIIGTMEASKECANSCPFQLNESSAPSQKIGDNAEDDCGAYKHQLGGNVDNAPAS